MNNKLLASLAVFRGLYNSEKDIYDVVSKFIEEVIIHHGIYSFEAVEMKNYLDDLFDFQLPEGIVKASTGRLDYVNIENRKFIVDKSKLNVIPYSNTNEDKNKSVYENILNGLIKYIGDNKNIEIDTNEKKVIENEFSLFLLNGTINNGYANLISKFIVSSNANDNFNRDINLIKEGVILYTGLKYTPNAIELGSWKSKITIYLDVEILFHAVGYNGELFKNIFDDFHKLVLDINKKTPLVLLKYFSETKNEVENFFTKAEYIVAGRDKLNSSIVAMDSIVKGCSSRSDIVERKIQFYDVLKRCNILEDEVKVEYNEENYKYNIISAEIEQELRLKYSQHAIDYALKLLNNMSIKREKKSVNNFENIGVILLSANSKILKIASSQNIKEPGKVPLATNIDFLTNKFWFKLNKGFGTNDYPKTFSIFTKAQIVLASHINDNLNNQFSKIQKNIKNKSSTEDLALNTLVFLKEHVKRPEDITSESIDEVYLLLNENSIEEIVNHHEYLKIEVEKQKSDKLDLEQQLNLKDSDLSLKGSKVNELRESLICEKEKRIIDLEKTQNKLDSKIKHKYWMFKTFIILITFSTVAIPVYFLNFNNLASLASIGSLLPLLLGFLYVIIFEKTIDPIKALNNHKNKIQEIIYFDDNYNKDEIQKLKDEIIKLNKED